MTKPKNSFQEIENRVSRKINSIVDYERLKQSPRRMAKLRAKIERYNIKRKTQRTPWTERRKIKLLNSLPTNSLLWHL